MFADFLSNYLSENKISYKRASELIGVDRRQLKRYVMRERMPKDKDAVNRIAEKLQMSEEEKRIFIACYDMSYFGKRMYRAYSLIEKIFCEQGELIRETFTETDREKRAVKKVRTDVKEREVTKIGSEEELLAIVEYMCSNTESVNVLFEDTGLYVKVHEVMHKKLRDNSDCEIQEVVILNENFDRDDTSDIEILEMLYANMISQADMKVYCLYVDSDERIGRNYFFTDKGMLTFACSKGSEIKISGFYTGKKEIVAYYFDRYLGMKKDSYLYGMNRVEEIETNMQIQNTYTNPNSSAKIEIIQYDSRTGVCIHNDDCSLLLLEDELVSCFISFLKKV